MKNRIPVHVLKSIVSGFGVSSLMQIKDLASELDKAVKTVCIRFVMLAAKVPSDFSIFFI